MASSAVAERPKSVRSMRDIGALPGIYTTDAKADALLDFLTRFKRGNGAEATPSYDAMANEIGAPEEAVHVLLRRLENRGKIHFISKRPPRIMLLGPDTVLPHEPTGPLPAREGAYDRFLDVEGQRMRLGRFVGDCERRLGRGPSLREMMDFTGFNNAGYVQRMAEMLSEKGLLQYGRGVPTKLTALGRRQFGLKPEPMEQMEPKMEQGKPTVVVVGRRPLQATVKLLCECLAEYKRETDGGSPDYRELARRLGFKGKGSNLGPIVAEAVRRGWLRPRAKGAKHNLHFTEKGRQRFMPELTAPPPTQAPEFAEVDEAPRLMSFPPAIEVPPEPMPEPEEPAPQPTWSEPPRYATGGGMLACVETSALIMELVERGYTVRKN